MEESARRWREADNQLIALLKAGKPADAAKLHGEQVVPRFNELAISMASYMEYREQTLAQINAETDTLISRTTFGLVFLGLFSAFAALLSGVMLTRSIAKPLDAVVAHLREVSQGDISRDVPAELLARQDETGALAKAMQAMSVNLRQMIKEITGGIHLLSSSSAELSSGSCQMTQSCRMLPTNLMPLPPVPSR